MSLVETVEAIDESQLIVPPPVAEPIPRPAPGRKTSEDPTWECVADGIWRNSKSKRRKTLFERPKIDGVFTFRSLHTSTTKLAKEELARRITQRPQGIEPTAKKETPAKNAKRKSTSKADPADGADEAEVAKPTTMGYVIRYYQDSEYPDEYKQERPDGTRKDEATHCTTLLEFWDTIPIEKCGPAACDRYHTWRTKTKKCRGGKGHRMVNRELNTLNNSCKWAARSELIIFNPIADRPNYQPASAVKHCREFMPHSADELHESAALLFEHPTTVVLGFQMIGEAYSGLRTKEFFKWGIEHFGSLTPDGEYVNVWRCKNQHGVNPYCRDHEGLKSFFAAHAAWKKANYPDSPYFLPSSRTDGPVGQTALAKALKRLVPKMKRRLKPHGAGRAFYVLMRRSQGTKDEVIAHELGHKSNGACIRSTYGGIPEEWLTGKAPNYSWLPSKVPLAWAKLEANGWKFPDEGSSD